MDFRLATRATRAIPDDQIPSDMVTFFKTLSEINRDPESWSVRPAPVPESVNLVSSGKMWRLELDEELQVIESRRSVKAIDKSLGIDRRVAHTEVRRICPTAK